MHIIFLISSGGGIVDVKKINIFEDNSNSKSERRKMLGELCTKIDEFFDNSSQYNLTYREGQHNMALDVFEAIESHTFLIVEDGVGIGKSYAYLIPLIYYYSLTGNQVRIQLDFFYQNFKVQLLFFKVQNLHFKIDKLFKIWYTIYS